VGLSEAHKRNGRFFLLDPCGHKTSLIGGAAGTVDPCGRKTPVYTRAYLYFHL